MYRFITLVFSVRPTPSLPHTPCAAPLVLSFLFVHSWWRAVCHCSRLAAVKAPTQCRCPLRCWPCGPGSVPSLLRRFSRLRMLTSCHSLRQSRYKKQLCACVCVCGCAVVWFEAHLNMFGNSCHNTEVFTLEICHRRSVFMKWSSVGYCLLKL